MTYMCDLLPDVMHTSNRIVVYSVINLVPRAHARIAPVREGNEDMSVIPAARI